MIHPLYVCLWIWFLSGVSGNTNEVKSVPVMEGESVTLRTDVNVQRDDLILWMFNVNNADTLIAQIHGQNIKIFNKTVIFGDQLKMDSQTGSLTIRNIRTEHSGLYKLTIIQEKTTYRTFSVAVYAHLPIPVIKSNSSVAAERTSDSRCSVLCSVLNVSAVSLSWYKGNSVLSSISVSDLSISLSLPLEVEYQDKNTYSCVINNTITNYTTQLNISQTCQPKSERMQKSHVMGITVSVVILLVLVVLSAVLIFFHPQKCKSDIIAGCGHEDYSNLLNSTDSSTVKADLKSTCRVCCS